MGTTSNFLKLRSTGTPKLGEWNIDYNKALELAKKNGKYIVTVWSNGDACGYCVNAEKCMMTDLFKSWMATSDAYFVFQYSGDKDKGKIVHDWVYNKTTNLKKYPGFRVTIYGKDGKIAYDVPIEGNTLRGSKTGNAGAKAMVDNLSKILANKPIDKDEKSDPEPTPATSYKVRLNESLTTKKVNQILDAIDKNDGYCPCQPKGEGTRCHCDDFIKEKKIGEPCICKIYVKQKK